MSHRRTPRRPSVLSPRGWGPLLGLAALHCTPLGPSAAQPGGPASADGAAHTVGGGGPAPANQATATPGPPPEAAAMEEPKFDFEAMLARERGPLPLVAAIDPRGRWQASIEARHAPLVVDRGDHVSVRVSLGSKDEVRCEVHDGQLNPGVTVANVLSAAAATIAIEGAALYRVGSAGGNPVVFVRTRYATRQEAPLAGELKLAISPGPQHSFVCLHDEPGYRGAFARVVEGFVASFQTATPERTPHHSALWQYQVGEAKTGYAWERVFVEPDGSVSSFTFELVLALLASGELRVRDYMAAEQHDGSGLQRASFLSYQGTTRAYEVQLERGPQGSYAYEGSADGKPISGRFTPKTPLASNYEVLLELARAKRTSGPLVFHQEEYHPRHDTLHLQTVEYSLDSDRKTLTRKRGEQVETLALRDGLPSGSRSTSGPNTFVGSIVAQESQLGSEPGVTLGAQPVPAAGSPFPLVEKRRNFETHVFGETDHSPAKTPPAGVLTKVTYAAPLGDNVAYVTPPRTGARRPAVIWIGGGLDWGIGEVAWAKAPREDDRSARAFRQAGLVLMLPALRGSNENPGKNECFLGEVDDLIAAANHVAARPDVDPERIYLAGHASGGTLALLAAASTDRFRAVFAFGPVSDARDYGTPSGGGCLPPEAAPEELELRAPINFVGSIRTPTFVFEGGVGGNADVFDALRERASAQVRFAVIPGLTSTGVLAPGTESIARAILSDRIDEAELLGFAKPASARRLP